VADDVGAAERRWLDEAVVLVHGVPAGGLVVVVLPLGGGTGNGLAVGGDFANMTMGVDGGHGSESREDGSSAGGVHLDRHVESFGVVELSCLETLCDGF
jgi:hypothetical protein